jgi:hypothetical protein
MPRTQFGSFRLMAVSFFSATLLGSAVLAPARASGDPASAGTLVAPSLPGTSTETGPLAIPDGAGGAFVGFRTPAEYKMHVARVDETGTPVGSWLPIGISGLSEVPGRAVQIASIAPDRVLILADNTVTFNPPAYLTRVVGENGLTDPEVSSLSSVQFGTLSIQGVPGGGAIVLGGSWNAAPSFRAAAYSAEGSPTGTDDIGVQGAIWHYTSDYGPPIAISPDGDGGAWAVGEVVAINTGTGVDLVATRVALDGTPLLTPAARIVTSAARDQTDAAVAPDGAQGVYIAWTDRRNLSQSSDVYGVRLLPDGSVSPGWTASGKPIASLAGDQFQPVVAADGAGGVWLAWIDSRTGENDLFYSHFGASGDPVAGYPAGGRVLCSAPGSQIALRIAADGSGGFYALWLDGREGELDLFAQHIHSTGVVMPGWTPDGVAICTNPTAKDWPGLLPLASGRVLATWTDSRTGVPRVYDALLPVDGSVTDVSRLAVNTLRIRPTRDPAHGAIDLLVSAAGTGELRVTLHDLTGRTLAERVLASPADHVAVRFDADALRPGLYFVRATRPGATTSTRISVVR